jgi:hypothetical protein
MDRVTDFESAGCAFDPRRGHSFFMPTPQANFQLIRILTDRLERISADSVWAHRASGLRGSLLRILDSEHEENPPDAQTIERVTNTAHYILTQAAKEK